MSTLTDTHASGRPDNLRASKRSKSKRSGDILPALAEEWLQSREYRGASPSTLQLYRRSATYLLEHCQEHGITEPAGITDRTLERFGFMLRQRVAATSADTYLRTVAYFLHWMQQIGEVVPGADFRRPPVPTVEVRPLDRKTMDRLVAAGASERDRLILEVLTSTGMRASELCRLRVDDISRHGTRFFLHVKPLTPTKGYARPVPISPSLFRRLAAYRDQTRPACATDRLFVSERKDFKIGDYAPLTRSGVRGIVRAAAERAGIKGRTYTHLLRHSFTTEIVAAGMPELAAAHVLGHSDTRMIQRHYGHLNAEHAYDSLMRALGQSDR